MKIRKHLTYPLVDRLIHLILIHPISTAISVRSFSNMKIVKNRLRNKMEDAFLAGCLITYIGKRIVERFSTHLIIDEPYDMK